MPIIVVCPACRHHAGVSRKDAGRSVRCAKCGAAFVALEAADAAASAYVAVCCTACGAKLKMRPGMEGHRARCPACRQSMKLPESPAPPPAIAPQPAPSHSSAPVPDWLPDVSRIERARLPPVPRQIVTEVPADTPTARCPGCRRAIPLAGPHELLARVECKRCGTRFVPAGGKPPELPLAPDEPASTRPVTAPHRPTQSASSAPDWLPDVLPAERAVPPPVPPELLGLVRDADLEGQENTDSFLPALPSYTSPVPKLLFLVTLFAAFVGVAVTVCLFPRSAIAERANEFMPHVTETTLTAKNPLLVMGIEGAVEYIRTPEEQRDQLGFFAQPGVWGTFLVVALLIGVGKDSVLTVAGPFTTPLDAIAFVVHWLGFLVGLVFVVVKSLEVGGQDFSLMHYLEGALVLCSCLLVYSVVFVVFSTIEAVIVINPFPFVAAGLKTFRSTLIGMLFLLLQIHPVLGFAASLVIFLVCLWLLHFSLRVTVLSAVYSAGIFRRVFGLVSHDGGERIRAFACCGFRAVPWFTCGRLDVGADGHLLFVYKPFFLLWTRTVALSSRTLAVAVGSINPYLLGQVGDKRDCALLRFSPVFCGREAWLCECLGLERVEDISLLTSLKQAARSVWSWFRDQLVGPGATITPA